MVRSRERLAYVLKRLVDRRHGLFRTDQFARALVGTLGAPRRLRAEQGGTRQLPISPRIAVIIQGTRQCSLGLLFQAVLMRSQEEKKSEADESCQHSYADPDWSCQPMDVVTQNIASQAH